MTPTSMPPSEHVLWSGTVRTKSLAERLEAATIGGFDALSMAPLECQQFTTGEDGLSPREVRETIEESDVDVTVLDPFTKWVPTWDPPADIPGLDLAFFDFDADSFFEMAGALDVDSITVFEPFTSDLDPTEGAEGFGAVCDWAAEHDMGVHLEFIPRTGVPDLETAWEIVRRADRQNGGLVFDTWHYLRGTRNGDLLATLPGDRIFHVQLTDAHAELRGSFEEDMLHHRVPLGEGDLELEPVMEILSDIGGLSSVGIELFSDDFDDLSPEAAGQHAGRNLCDFLDTVA